jgi:hypothetical protein
LTNRTLSPGNNPEVINGAVYAGQCSIMIECASMPKSQR